MSRRPIGDHAMTAAQRQRRYRAKVRASRNARPAIDPVRDFLVRQADVVADDIYRRLCPDMARDIALALKRRLLQNGHRSEWQPPPRTNTGARLGWMAR
jgi:hypothetical protein